jgi:hypothetical protein
MASDDAEGDKMVPILNAVVLLELSFLEGLGLKKLSFFLLMTGTFNIAFCISSF